LAGPSYLQLRVHMSGDSKGHTVKARHSASLRSYGVGWTMVVVTLGLEGRAARGKRQQRSLAVHGKACALGFAHGCGQG